MYEDAEQLLCHRPQYSTVGGSGYYIQYKRQNETVGKEEPAGVVCTPFSAETRAAIHAFEHVLLSPGFRLQYRWIVDCQSICTALSTLGEEDTALLYHLRRLITDLTTRHENNLDIVWVSSHCGAEGDEEADKLAKAALRRPLQLGALVLKTNSPYLSNLATRRLLSAHVRRRPWKMSKSYLKKRPNTGLYERPELS